MTSEGSVEDAGLYELQRKTSAAAVAATENSHLVTKDEGSRGPSGGLWSLPRRDKFILLSLFLVQLVGVMGLSVMAPFFPKEAGDKGMNATMIGWVFGVYALTQFIMSPIFGKVLHHFGCKCMIVCGESICGIGFICFGFLTYVSDETLFASLCFLLRILTAVGSAASSTAGFAVVSQLFPGQLSTAYGMLEAAAGLGWMIGPAFGGFLHSLYGFILPFVVLGSLILIMVPVYARLIPGRPETSDSSVADDGGGTKKDEDEEPGGSRRLLKLLLHPSVVVMCLVVVTAPLVWSSLQPTIEPHLRSFNLSDVALGGIFVLIAAFYAVCCPIAGCVTDRITKLSLPLMATGFFFSSCALVFLGPSPILTFIHQQNLLWLNLVALIVLAVSASFSIVPSYNKIINSIGSMSELNLSVHGAVAGLYNSCYALGEFLGPSVGGFLCDKIGFAWSVTATASLCCAMGCCILLLWIYELRRLDLTAN